jgi:hypothetical protein
MFVHSNFPCHALFKRQVCSGQNKLFYYHIVIQHTGRKIVKCRLIYPSQLPHICLWKKGFVVWFWVQGHYFSYLCS